MERPVLRILLVIDSLASGGAQRQMVWLARGLAERGHRVTLFNYHPEYEHFRAQLEAHDIEILDEPKRRRYSLGPVLALRKLRATGDFDILLSFLNGPNVYSVLACLGQTRTKVVVSERWMFPDGPVSWPVRLCYQFYRFADAITVNSHHQYDRIARSFPWSGKQLVTIWNGVDLDSYRPGRQGPTAGENELRLLAVGTVVPWKNAYKLIEGLAKARASGARVSVAWAGKVTPDEQSEGEYSRCETLLDELDLREAWHWLGECSDMHKLYGGSDALVHPSTKEGLPNAICEGLAFGLPVLASKIGDHPLIVKDNLNGWLFDPEDADSIAAAIVHLWQASREDRDRMGCESRRLAESQLSIERLVDDYERLLTGLCQIHSEKLSWHA